MLCCILAIAFTFSALVSGSVILPGLNTTSDGFTASCTITEYSQTDAVLKSCTNILLSNVKVPAGKSLNLHLKDGATLTIRGTITFEVSHTEFWFMNISGKKITVIGETGSVIDGQGQKYWDGHGGSGGVKKPHVLSLHEIHGGVFKNIHIKNCPQFCTGMSQVSDITIDGWVADCSLGHKLGKNTDGIGISWAKNIKISNAVITNQDQCVYVNQGSDMVFKNIHCIGGHGICATAGFGVNNYEENTTKNITFQNFIMDGGIQGIRVIAMYYGGPGEITDITFDNIELKEITREGISVRMDYGSDGHLNNNIAVTGIKMNNVHGTVASHAMPVDIKCGQKCSNWKFSNINIHGGTKSSCNFHPTGFNC